jgi:nucleoside 2-deoxyribosyltransferase
MKVTTPKKFIFVLMPFDDNFDDVYEFGIKAACDPVKVYCERVDEQIFKERLLDRIYNQISKADLIIADMTGKNPNVYYETGYAHALGKNVILVTKSEKDIPFDLKDYHHIIYNDKIKDLQHKLKERIDWFLRQPVIEQVKNIFPYSFQINGTELIEKPTIEIIVEDNWQHSHATIKVDIKNRTKEYLREEFQLGLECPGNRKLLNQGDNLVVDGDKKIWLRKVLDGIFPVGWHSVTFEIDSVTVDELVDLKLLVYTNLDLIEYEFQVKFIEKVIDKSIF